jgi:hypothetical protein
MSLSEPTTITLTDPRKTIFKASGATLVALLGILFVAVQWGETLLDFHFMTDKAYALGKTEMQEAVAQHEAHIEAQVSSIAKTQTVMKVQMDSHIKDFGQMVKSITLADAVDLYNNADEALYLHKRYEARDGVTPSSAARRHELERRKTSAKEYRDCVLEERPNCEALRPR